MQSDSSQIGTVMQAYIFHHIYYGFWCSAENSKKLAQKPHFVGEIWKFLDHALFWCMVQAPIFGQMKGPMDIHNCARFHLHSICGSQVIYSQSFWYQKKGGFMAAFGWFLVYYNPKSSPICRKFSPAMQCMAKYHICYGFWYISKNTKKWSQKTYFLGFFQRFFGHTLPRPKSDTQIFCQMKGLMKIHNRAKFHLRSICGSQVINFQKFSWQWSSHELGHFGGFLGPNSPKSAWILIKLAPEVVLEESNRLLKFLSKIPISTETTR